MIRLQRRESGPYFAGFSLHIPDMRVETVKICPRSRKVYIEPVFRYRTPKSDRLLGVRRRIRSQMYRALPKIQLPGRRGAVLTPPHSRIPVAGSAVLHRSRGCRVALQ